MQATQPPFTIPTSKLFTQILLKWGSSQKLLLCKEQASQVRGGVEKAGRLNNVIVKLCGHLGHVHLSQDDLLGEDKEHG